MKLAAPAAQTRAPGRPAHCEAARWMALVRVREQLEVQGESAGWRPIAAALGDEVPTKLVQWARGRWRVRRRQQRAKERARQRVQVQAQAPDGIWSVDATHLGRLEDGRAVQAEVVKDLATTALLGASVGLAASGAEVVALLERCRQERGRAPLVLMHDNGASYWSWEVSAWCWRHGVIELVNVPRTPQHNAACERGIGELKQEAGLGESARLDPLEGRLWLGAADSEQVPAWCLKLRAAQVRLNEGRLRASRGYRTAAQLDRDLPTVEAMACRESFYRTACLALRAAEQRATSARARHRAKREAVYGTLERFGLVKRTRGGRPFTAASVAGVS